MSAIQLLEKIGASSDLKGSNSEIAQAMKILAAESLIDNPDANKKKWCVFVPAEDDEKDDEEPTKENDETNTPLQ
jgi:hypothetical protein